MTEATRNHIANVCTLWANGYSIVQIARKTGRNTRSISTTLDRHYRMKFKRMGMIVIESRMDMAELEDN